VTALKSLLFFLFVPGLLLGFLPWWISQSDSPLFDPGPLQYLAVPLWVLGAAGMIWCFRDFTVKGRGTPAPFDPPREFVATGLYRHVRNPMYVSGLIALTGWVFWSPSLAMVVAFLVFILAVHTFVVLYEEPALKRKFGTTYEDYLRSVPRWIPRF
jgi:protein-S-isoprenylcysteine O-methyltransferase Ste14